MKKAGLYLCILFFSLVFNLFGKPTLAQETQAGFSITPFYQNIDIGQDQSSVPFSINVKNNTNVPAVFRISVLDFGTLNESGGVAFLGSSDNLKYGLASWVSLSNDTLVLAPGEDSQVKGMIENRESLSPGGHYGAVFFKIDDNGAVEDNKKSIAFDPSFASLLFVRKTGGEIVGLKMDSFDMVKSIFALPNQIKIRFQNTGNVHVVPRGTVEIFDPWGRLVSKSVINSESGIILPETFRVFGSKFMPVAASIFPGKYTLVSNYRYDGKNDFTTEKINFFLLPLNFVLIISLIIVLSISVGIIYRNKK